MNIKTVAIVPLGFIAAVLLFAFAIVALQPSTANAQAAPAQKQEQKNQDEKKEEKKEEKPTSVVYNYVAQSGDSYSKIARKAVQTYGLKHKVKLSGAQIVFAETSLTQAAGAPTLVQGQAVSVAEADVKAWVEKAQNLSDEQAKAWDYYVQFVNFNTNSVGEVRS